MQLRARDKRGKKSMYFLLNFIKSFMSIKLSFVHKIVLNRNSISLHNRYCTK